MQQREHERGDLLRKRPVSLAAERRHLRALHGGEQAVLMFHNAGLSGRSTELRRYRLVELDQILDGQVACAAVSR